jgi:hypothetical protein
MVQYLQLRSGNAGPPFVGENDLDTILWDATRKLWYVGAGGGGGAVDSVFGRTGVVVAATGDYDGDQVDNVSSVPGASVSDALEYLLANAGAVDSVFGRTGAVVSATGDYDSDQVDNASGVSGSSVSDALDALLAGLGLAGLKIAPALGNANGTISLTGGSLFYLPAATLNANRVYTIDRNGLPTNTPGTLSMVYFLCLDTTANTKTIANGGAGGGNPMVVAASAPIALYAFVDDGTNWNFVSQTLVQV